MRTGHRSRPGCRNERSELTVWRSAFGVPRCQLRFPLYAKRYTPNGKRPTFIPPPDRGPSTCRTLNAKLRTPNVDSRSGKRILPPCPPTPNCVATQRCAPSQAMDPIPFSGSPDAVQGAIRRAMLAEPRTRITIEEPGYVRAESRSRVFRFVDDVEMAVDAD